MDDGHFFRAGYHADKDDLKEIKELRINKTCLFDMVSYRGIAVLTTDGQVKLFEKELLGDYRWKYNEISGKADELKTRIEKWTDIVDVAVVSCGSAIGYIPKEISNQLSFDVPWETVIYAVIGLKRDGTLIKQYFLVSHEHGNEGVLGILPDEIHLEELSDFQHQYFGCTDQWDRIISIRATRHTIYALKLDGTVISSDNDKTLWNNVISMEKTSTNKSVFFVVITNDGRVQFTSRYSKNSTGIRLFNNADEYIQKRAEMGPSQERINELKEEEEKLRDKLNNLAEVYDQKMNEKKGLFGGRKKKEIDQYAEQIEMTKKELERIEFLVSCPDYFEYSGLGQSEQGQFDSTAIQKIMWEHDKQQWMQANAGQKEASVIGRAAAGAVIAGPAGAVVGALSAVDKNNRNKK